MNNVKQGTVIIGPSWPEPVEIKLIEEKGDYIHIVGATKNSSNSSNKKLFIR